MSAGLTSKQLILFCVYVGSTCMFEAARFVTAMMSKHADLMRRRHRDKA